MAFLRIICNHKQLTKSHEKTLDRQCYSEHRPYHGSIRVQGSCGLVWLQSNVKHACVCVEGAGSLSGITAVVQLRGKEGVSMTSQYTPIPWIRAAHSRHLSPELPLLHCPFFIYNTYTRYTLLNEMKAINWSYLHGKSVPGVWQNGTSTTSRYQCRCLEFLWKVMSVWECGLLIFDPEKRVEEFKERLRTKV